MLELNLVKIFHQKYKIPILDDPSVVPMERIRLRQTLLNEELHELIEADTLGDIENTAKEAGDVVYVLLGTVLELGYYKSFERKKLFSSKRLPLDKDACLREITKNTAIFQSNWSKKQLATVLNAVTDYVETIGLKEYFPKIIQEVHRSNMSKGTNGQPLIREDGKILKGTDFSPADMSFLTP